MAKWKSAGAKAQEIKRLAVTKEPAEKWPADMSPPPVLAATQQVEPSRDGQLSSSLVNHPDHYGGGEDPYEAIKVIEAWGLGFNLGSAIKYIKRAGLKGSSSYIEDLEKAFWYLRRQVQLARGVKPAEEVRETFDRRHADKRRAYLLEQEVSRLQNLSVDRGQEIFELGQTNIELAAELKKARRKRARR